MCTQVPLGCGLPCNGACPHRPTRSLWSHRIFQRYTAILPTSLSYMASTDPRRFAVETRCGAPVRYGRQVGALSMGGFRWRWQEPPHTVGFCAWFWCRSPAHQSQKTPTNRNTNGFCQSRSPSKLRPAGLGTLVPTLHPHPRHPSTHPGTPHQAEKIPQRGPHHPEPPSAILPFC